MNLTPQDRRVTTEKMGNTDIRLSSYKLGDRFICAIDNIIPGAIIARGRGPTRLEAEQLARVSAKKVLGN